MFLIVPFIFHIDLFFPVIIYFYILILFFNLAIAIDHQSSIETNFSHLKNDETFSSNHPIHQISFFSIDKMKKITFINYSLKSSTY